MDLVPNHDFNVILFPETVHYEKPVGQTTGKMKIAFAHLTVEFDVFLFHPVRHVGNPVLDPLQADFSWNVQNNRKVGNDFAHRKGVDLSDRVIGNLTGNALINRG